MNKFSLLSPLNKQDANSQVKLAIGLMSAIPALAFFYMGAMLYSKESPSALTVLPVFCCTIAISVSGYFVLRKYSQSIVKLRRLITEVAEGTLPEQVMLDEVGSSDDLKYIEFGINAILCEMANRLRLIEEKYKVEAKLRKALEKQQQSLMQAERHRVMIQSLGAACHHLGQPATILRMRLFMLKERAQSLEEITEIEESIKEVDVICEVLRRLREANEFRTESYLSEGDPMDQQILAI